MEENRGKGAQRGSHKFWLDSASAGEDKEAKRPRPILLAEQRKKVIIVRVCD